MTLPNLSRYGGLKQAQIDWLLRAGVTVESMIRPEPIRLAHGIKADDGRFEEGEGTPWLAFSEPNDVVYWQPRTNDLATWEGRAFALGEEAISKPETYAFDCNLNVFPSPLEWLQAKRDGIVVLDWSRAFEWLRDAPRIAISETLLLCYRQHMKPGRLPELSVIRAAGRAAA